MNPSLLLTTFVTVAGIFTFCCSLRNYDWFFEFPGPSRIIIKLLGRKISRWLYLIFGAGLAIWGISRIIDPPRRIPTDFIHALATPGKVDLTKPQEGLRQLTRLRNISNLQADHSGWISFWSKIDPNETYFSDASASTTVGPDFHEGFALRSKSYAGRTLEGRIIYLDDHLVSCDNALFSKHPLDSASFVIIICTPEASRKNGDGESLSVFYCRAGSELYRQLIRK